jgi:hypothetical protein
MSQRIIYTILFATFFSCDSPTKKERITESNNATEQKNSEFENYISTLDRIPLPLEANTLGQFPKTSKNFDKNAFKKYKHIWTSQPLGIYYQDNNTIGIIDCSIGDWGLVPFLTTYDLEGNKIDSTGFYRKSGQDMGYEAIEHVTFNADRTITVLDTVKRWDMNKDETDIIEESIQILTGKAEYRVLNNGRIEYK